MRSLPFFAFSSLLLLSGCGSSETSTSGSGGTSAGVGGGTTTTTDTGGGTTGTTTDTSTGSGAPDGPIAGKVKRYDYVFDMQAMTADTKLAIDVAAPGGNCIDLQSRAALSGNVTWNGGPTTEASAQVGVFHACGPAVGPGPLQLEAPTKFLQKTYFNLDVGFSKTKDMAGGEFTYLLSWVKGCDAFGPCDNDPAALAEFHIDVKHAPGTTVLCPGELTYTDTNAHCDIAGTLAPTYSAVGWAADPLWKAKPFMSANGVDFVFYEVPTGKLASKLDPAVMSKFFGWITGLFGPFPYGNELRFAGGPTAWLGFEHPANIVLLENLDTAQTDYADALTHVAMHETTHQWAGDRSTIASGADFVWKEATAEYMPYVFEDENLPPDVAAATRKYWDTVSLFSNHYPRPTDKPELVVAVFYGDVYGPGPMVLYVQLEALIGRPAVIAGIQAFLKDPGARSVDDLRKAMEASSATDLKAYFDAWVFGSGAPEWPTMNVETSQVGSEVTVKVTQQNASGKIYPCVIEVDVQGATKTATAKIDFGLAPKDAFASAKVTLDEPVVSTVLDPRNKVVARDKAAMALPAKKPPVWIF
jgi:aminopeptidase N